MKRNRHRLRSLALAASALTVLLLAACQQARTIEPGTQEVVLSDLNGPMGVNVDADGTLYVVDSGIGGDVEVAPGAGIFYGDTSEVIRVEEDGSETVIATLPSLRFEDGGAAGASRLAFYGDDIYVASGEFQNATDTETPFFVGVVRLEEDAVVGVTDTWDFEVAFNPDEVELLHTNPFGLAAGPMDSLWLTDAGANALLQIDPATGAATLVAAFEQRTITDPETNQPVLAEPVPTGITVGDDGNLYVSFFHGGIARVTPEGEVTDLATEPIALTDIRLGPDGELYAVQIANEMFEPESGRILRFQEDGSFETVVDGLPFPSSIAFEASGDAFVTVNTLGAPGTGEVLEIARLTDL